jgi:AcrR family transcriptional regulator
MTFRSAREDRQADRAEHLVDRFQRAIERLGHETRSVRLGGIHLLRKLAEADPGYSREVIDILAAYIRDRAPWSPQPARRHRFFGTRSVPASSMETDILAAVASLRTMMRRYTRTNVDLRQCDLSGAHLEGMRLVDARLTDSNLSGAYLSDADLDGADLRGATLTAIHVLDANLTNTRITTRWRDSVDFSHAKNVDDIQWC